MDNDPPRDPNADVTDALAARTPSDRALDMALIDRIQAIIGNHQLRVEDAQDETRKAIVDMRHQMATANARAEAEANDRAVVVDYLKRQDKQLEGLGAGQQQLRSEFREIGEVVSGLAVDVGDLKQRMDRAERTLKAHDQSRDASIAERTTLRANQEQMLAGLNELRTQLDRLARRSALPDFGLFEVLPDGIVIVDAAGTIMQMNAVAERLFGHARGELIGQSLEVLVPESQRDLHRAHRMAFGDDPHARAMGYGRTFSALHADGTTFPAEIGLTPIQIGELACTIATVRDVRSRLAADKVS